MSNRAKLAVDIGGTNIRCGVVETRWKKAPDLSKATVWKSELWRHADDEPTREGAVKRLVKMLKDLIAAAEKENLKLAPFIGIGAGQGIQDFCFGDIGATKRETKRRSGLVEQPHPGAAPTWRAFGKHPFHFSAELIGRHCPHTPQPRGPDLQCRILLNSGKIIRRHLRNFQLDKQHHGADFRACLGN